MGATKRKPLTEEEAAASLRLKAIWEKNHKRLGLTQESAAHKLGWSSQGAVWQYLHSKIPLNWSAVVGWAKLLEVTPEDIYPELAHKLGQKAERRAILPPDAQEVAELYRQLSPRLQRDIISFLKIAVTMTRMGADISIHHGERYREWESVIQADMERRNREGKHPVKANKPQ